MPEQVLCLYTAFFWPALCVRKGMYRCTGHGSIHVLYLYYTVNFGNILVVDEGQSWAHMIKYYEHLDYRSIQKSYVRTTCFESETCMREVMSLRGFLFLSDVLDGFVECVCK